MGSNRPPRGGARASCYFFDSSAIVKRYHQETGSPWVHAVCNPRTRPLLDLSGLAQVEVSVALHRTGRHEQLHSSFVDLMVNQFERHLALSDPSRSRPFYRIVPVSPTVLTLAAQLGNRYWDATPHPLRSLDAIQLATALMVAQIVSNTVLFVTADTRLTRIAPLEGLTTYNPEHAPQP